MSEKPPSVAQRLRNTQVWARHDQYAAEEPEGYSRDSAPFEAADMLDMQAREIDSLRAENARLLQEREAMVAGHALAADALRELERYEYATATIVLRKAVAAMKDAP